MEKSVNDYIKEIGKYSETALMNSNELVIRKGYDAAFISDLILEKDSSEIRVKFSYKSKVRKYWVYDKYKKGMILFKISRISVNHDIAGLESQFELEVLEEISKLIKEESRNKKGKLIQSLSRKIGEKVFEIRSRRDNFEVNKFKSEERKELEMLFIYGQNKDLSFTQANTLLNGGKDLMIHLFYDNLELNLECSKNWNGVHTHLLPHQNVEVGTLNKFLEVLNQI